MGAIGGEDLVKWEKMQGGVGNGSEEKILVLVRLRPLSQKEIAKSEVSDWECINETTILYRNSLQERSGLPTAYSFDGVFRGDCSTREVYEEGVKEIALSVVTGINSTIFAYGQTSSGKTYTMNGITEYTVEDIYDYIQRHEERAFVLKFSAMEMYNEVVRDLLSSDNTSLRLLDDPERGTIIEKLTEETLRDKNHLKELLSICEAQRKVGETSLNETSSRSHQILRLTIESSAREFIGKDKSTTLSASVNFVDLAGSERASQALSVGQRLKEGCHINRSLLTLGIVIRKLSKGRQGFVNYRESKLTRILQHSLGGNARTAIICTLSPARSHVEQSRNTLLFACCAKEVTTNARVNVVMSDKALVKHLQKELARLESELKNPGPPGDYTALLRKKDLQIEKLEKEVRELTKQRDLAESRIEDLLRMVEDGRESKRKGKDGRGSSSKRKGGHASEDECSVSGYMGEEACSTYQGRQKFAQRVSEEDDDDDDVDDNDDMIKEVRCIESDNSGVGKNSPEEESEGRTSRLLVSTNVDVADSELLTPRPRGKNDVENNFLYGNLEQKQQDVRNTIDSLATPYASELFPLSRLAGMSSRSLKLSRSQSCRADLMKGSSGNAEAENDTTPPNGLQRHYPGRPEGFQRKQWNIPPFMFGADSARLSRNNSQSSVFADELKAQGTVAGDEDIPSVDAFVAGLKEMARLQYGSQLQDQVQHMESKVGKNVKDIGLDAMPDDSLGASSDWPLEFERMQRVIIELWHTCNVSVIHRTYFFMLFKGDDPMDSIYMEVEVRRLSYLKETFAEGNPVVQNGQTLTSASSLKALRRERQMLSRLMYKRFTEEERNGLYQEWGVSLNSKQRRLQLAHLLWSDNKDMSHIAESASVVAKLIRFSEQGQALKAMFGLSFTPPRPVRRSFGWKNSMANLL